LAKKNIFQKASRLFFHAKRQLYWSEAEKKYFHILKIPRKKNGKDIVCVQCVTEDLYYYTLFALLAKLLNEQNTITIKHILTHSLNTSESHNVIGFLSFRWIYNLLLAKKWSNLYKSFSSGEAYRSCSTNFIYDFFDFKDAFKQWKSLQSKDCLLNFEIHHIKVGDLINDSYLRYKPAPTVDIKDFYLCIVIWQAYRDARKALKFFKQKKPKLYMSSYSTYVQHGVAVRVALKLGTRVVSFGNFQEFMKELSIGDMFHTKNASKYKSSFNVKFETEKKNALELSSNKLVQRLNGGRDLATSYMKVSAYSKNIEIPNGLKLKNAVIIYLHDFFDSPHIYDDMLFPDFLDWITTTVSILTQHKIQFYIKPHPNQIKESEEVLDKLSEMLSELKILPSSINNKQLAESGISCIVTVYGTISHEMAYLGIPSITCARHPHISFGFCFNASNLTEYNKLLKKSQNLIYDKDLMKREALEFYYMHNLNIPSDEIKLLDYSQLIRQEQSQKEYKDNFEKIEKFEQLILKTNIIPRLSTLIN
jgi:hypothetical protein